MRNDHNNYLEQKKGLMTANKQSEPSASTSSASDSSASVVTAVKEPKETGVFLKYKKNFLNINDESEKTSSMYLSEKSLRSSAEGSCNSGGGSGGGVVEENHNSNTDFGNEFKTI